MLKSAARTQVLRYMDAVGSTRWDTAANGEVDQAIGRACDAEWRKILDANPYYAAEQITLISDSSGRYLKSGLSTGVADAAHRLFRVISLVVAGTPLPQARFSDFSNASIAGAAPYAYWEFGQYFQAFPATASQSGVFTINYLPTKQDSLAGEGSTFNFPDGFEDIPLMETAAVLLTKGGAETEAAVTMRQVASSRREDLISTITRPTIKALGIKYEDSSTAWGGQ